MLYFFVFTNTKKLKGQSYFGHQISAFDLINFWMGKPQPSWQTVIYKLLNLFLLDMFLEKDKQKSALNLGNMMFATLKKTQTRDLRTKLQGVIITTVLSVILFLNFIPSFAWADEGKGSFQLTTPCNGTTSISGKNPIALDVYQIYKVSAFNKAENPSHASIQVPGVGSRWVNLSCGVLENSSVATISTDSQTVANKTESEFITPEFIPFFDNIDNPVQVENGNLEDLSPPAPVLNEFDIAINELCGPVGKVVEGDEFKATLRRFPDVLANIKGYVGDEIFPGRSSDEEFLDDLTTLWFKALGFDHVFCGEPGAKKIGGLHYAGRYLDLQNKGLAGISPNSKAEVEPGAVYTLGVVLKVGDRILKDPIKGYGYTLNAEEILKIGAKAYKDNPNDEPGTKACILTLTDDGKTFANIFVAKNGAIRTFFPDATPDYERSPSCNQ